MLLVAFGIVVGAGIVRTSEPDPMAGQPLTGSRPLASLPSDAPSATAAVPPETGGTGRVVPPEVLRGMLQAARASLAEGRYGEAIAAYQAVLKRDPKNVDAMTHLALIVAIGGGPEHVDRALEAFDKALALDPSYLPALLYRGQVLYEIKKDTGGAIRSWEKYVAVSPPGEDRDRVVEDDRRSSRQTLTVPPRAKPQLDAVGVEGTRSRQARDGRAAPGWARRPGAANACRVVVSTPAASGCGFARGAGELAGGDVERALVLEREREIILALIADDGPVPAHADVERRAGVGDGHAARVDLDSALGDLLGDLVADPRGPLVAIRPRRALVDDVLDERW